MSLRSKLFRGDPKLEAAATSDPAHIVPGAVGRHVAKIHEALIVLDDAKIERSELQNASYGPTTAGAVLAYKQKRNIINRSYQTKADNIVGKMTMAALDDEMARIPPSRDPEPQCHCGNHFARGSGGGQGAGASRSFGVGGPPRFTPVAGPLQIGRGSGQSPKAAALARIPLAKEWVSKTLEALDRANAPTPRPNRPTPLKEWQGLNANFGVPHGFASLTQIPGAPIAPILGSKAMNTKADYIDHLVTFYNRIKQFLDSGSAFNETFLKKDGIVGDRTYAITLTKNNNSLDPSLPDGMYFTPFFVTAGANKQAEIVVHECAHFVENSGIQDVVHPDDAAYSTITPRIAIQNAFSYSTLAIHTMFNFTGILEHNR
jgi:hypothetical protein